MHFRHSIMIATHNRREDLRHTLEKLGDLSPAPDEVLVCCDGCTDGTADMLRQEFPKIVLLENTPGLGSVGSRCRLLEAATGEIISSFDDDSHPIETDFLARVDELFQRMPRLGLASFPQRTDEFPETLEAADFGPSQFVATYAASAASFRLDACRSVPGWDPAFHHAYEEPDLALQLVAAGWMVYHFTGVTVRHHYSATNRDEIRIHQRHARNEQWSIWKRCPAPQLVFVSIYRAVRQFQYACRRGVGWVAREPRWWLAALRGWSHCRRTRQPVPWRAYLGWMKLFRHPAATEGDWNRLFPR